MKIYEITRPNGISVAQQILQKAGYERLGKGSFASVYARPDKPFCLKLFGYDDQAYLQYLKLITTISNPHFPVVKGKPIRVTDNYYAVQLERLAPLSPNYVDFTNKNKCRQFMKKYTDLNNLEGERLHDTRYNQQSASWLPIEINKLRISLELFRNRYPDLAKALELIHKYVIEPTGAEIDMHIGNFMMRGNTLVISDPVAYAKSDSEDLAPALKSPKQLGFPWNNTPTETPDQSQNITPPPESTRRNNFGSEPPLLKRMATPPKLKTEDERLLKQLGV